MSSKDNIGGPNMDQSWIGRVAVRVIIFAIAMAVFFSWLTSCSPRLTENLSENTKIEYRDSIQYRDTILRIPIPLEKDQVIAHVGDTSKLETSLAKSTAFMGVDGFIHHSLENKKGTFDVPAKIPYRTIQVQLTSEKTQTLTKIEYRDKPLSWWRKFQIGAFWWLVGAVVILLLWTFRKLIFRIP